MKPSTFPIDSASILFLAQFSPDHTNVYRLCVTMTEPVCPETLQRSADRIYARFPTIFAGFRPGFFSYSVIPASQPPQVRRDPGFLHTMTPEELHSCACRVYYQDCQIIVEAFHALTDGCGAIISLRALLAEYIFLRFGHALPEREMLLQEPDWEEETRDGYLQHRGKTTGSLPRRSAYQLPGDPPGGQIQRSLLQVPSPALLDAARRSGVTVTTLLAVLMAESVMEFQHRHSAAPAKPVRIMVPVDLRRLFPSRTLRNFILFALPTLEPEEAALPRAERLERFRAQLRHQFQREVLAPQITRNVVIQRNLLFRILPMALKKPLMLLSNRIFGETNSSITLTNLGAVALSEEMAPYVCRIEPYLTPRRRSPYNCGILSRGDTTAVTITRFGPDRGLEETFFRKIRELL